MGKGFGIWLGLLTLIWLGLIWLGREFVRDWDLGVG